MQRLQLREFANVAKERSDSFFFWCPFSLIGFLFVPFHLRVLYGTSVCLLWDTFLSYASHNKIGEMVSKLEDKVGEEETPDNITDDT